MKYLWFQEDDFPDNRRGIYRRDIYRLQLEPTFFGQRWDSNLRAWVYSEKPEREYFLGPDFLSYISVDEARSLLPAEALPDWRGQIIFKFFSLELVRVQGKRKYSWGVPRYEAKDPNPEPLHALRMRQVTKKLGIWQTWNRAEQRWQIDGQTTRSGKFRGCKIDQVGEEYLRRLLPYRAFTDLPCWQIRVENSGQASPNWRLIAKWKNETPPSA